MKKKDTFISRFLVLKGAVRELWIIYFAKVFEILSYAIMNSAVVLWLSSDLGYSDANAGYLIAVWSSVLSLCTVLVGSFADAVGIRKAFLFGFTVCAGSRLVMSFVHTKLLVLAFGLFPLALGLSLMTPVMISGVKRYSSTAQRSMAFSTFYVLMNVAFAIAGWLFDFIRNRLGEHAGLTLPLGNIHLSTYQVLFLIGFVLTLPGWLLTYSGLREGIEVTDEGVKITAKKARKSSKNFIRSTGTMLRDTLRETAGIFTKVWGQPAFYRFLVFLGLVVAVRLVYYHMYYTFPKFGIRELGEGAPIGRLWGLNPILIVLFVPFVGALTQKISAYRMVIVGSSITAFAVFFMAMPPEVFSSIANGWLGDLIAHKWLGMKGPVSPLYISITLSVFLISVGEALWSPRLYEYTAAIAPKGMEASYMSLSILPYFIAKFFVGGMSGLLLQKYCPATGDRHSQTMWLLIALMTIVTPLGLLVFRKYIQVKEQGRVAETPA